MAEAKVACPSCKGTYTKAGMGRHLLSCLGAGEGTLLSVTAKGDKAYWLFLVASPEATLQGLDALLRDVWLECCGHLSRFQIGGTQYMSQLLEEDFGYGPPQRAMTATITSVLPPGSSFDYDYDFGSTTKLAGRAVGRVAPRGERVTLLARNAPLPWTCDTCGKKPAGICPGCGQISCSKCAKKECGCGGGERWAELMPIVNSPRMGVCGYTG